MANPLDSCSEADLKRFAACWLYADRNNVTVDWASAAQAFDSKVQVQSFKTVTGRAVVKILGDEAKPKKAAGGGGKRKKAAGEDDGDDAPKAKKGKGGRAKKVKTEEKVASDDDEGWVDAENGDLV